MHPITATGTLRGHKPPWLKARFPGGERFSHIRGLLRDQGLNTVCEEAHCPNIGECFNAGTATFMILGETCTRACSFCAVTSGRPGGLDLLEPYRLARTVEVLGLDYIVITSVNRDDLPDGGAFLFAACIRAVHHLRPDCEVEVLIPDFEGNWDALGAVLEARPAILNHNIESVSRLYPRVRPKARYERSLELFRRTGQISPGTPVKSGFMLGLGETFEEVARLLEDLRAAGVDIVTVGQYLRPSTKHQSVDRYVTPEEFGRVREMGERLGFAHIESGPFVRSSYHAAQQAHAAHAVPR